MVGYAPNGYRLWNKSTRRIVIACDVNCNENCFLYENCIVESGAKQLIIPMTSDQQEEEDEVQVEPNVENDDQERS